MSFNLVVPMHFNNASVKKSVPYVNKAVYNYFIRDSIYSLSLKKKKVNGQEDTNLLQPMPSAA